jgi:hypothetical protein
MWSGIAGLALLAVFLLWLLRGRSAGQRDEQLTYEEREAQDELRLAEEEVRNRESGTSPDEEQEGDDWGPGTATSYR